MKTRVIQNEPEDSPAPRERKRSSRSRIISETDRDDFGQPASITDEDGTWLELAFEGPIVKDLQSQNDADK